MAKRKKKKTAEDLFRAKFKNPKQPDDFDDIPGFLEYAIKLFDNALEDDKENREQAEKDAEFAVGEQWEEIIKRKRQTAKKPTLTFNRLPAFIAQLVGNRRMNETQATVIADDGAYKKEAKVRQGLIRSIQKTSSARVAFNKAFENQVICGIGNFEVALEYAHDDVFEQDAKIKPINNTFSVVWPSGLDDPTGADAPFVFVVSSMTHEEFKDEWPNSTAADIGFDTRLLGYGISPEWITQDEVRIVSFWRMRSRRRIVALVRDTAEDGTTSEDVEDITDIDLDEDMINRIVLNQRGTPIMREVDRKYAELYTITATDILEGPYELPISRVPIFRVPGWEIHVGSYASRFGLVRFLKDPQRLHNYWRSVIAEKLIATPKGNWVASIEAVEGREEAWRESHLSDNPLLIYNGDAGTAPQRVPPAQIEAGLIEQAGMAAQDLKDISNLHEANLGQKSNEVSGKAIMARQRVGETGTVIYQDNLDLSIEQCGMVLNELIPHVYNTARTIKILGDDAQDVTAVTINDVTNEDGMDITAGKYTVTSTTGPSYVTKRVEAQDSMLNMVNAMPQTMAIAADKIVEAQDWPGAEEIARRLRTQLPPGMVPEKDMSDDQKAIAAQQSQAQQAEAQKADAIFQLELREKQARAALAEAQAEEAVARAQKAIAEIGISQTKVQADIENERVKRHLEAAQTFDNITKEQE